VLHELLNGSKINLKYGRYSAGEQCFAYGTDNNEKTEILIFQLEFEHLND
jgi:hypothetical protein